MKSSDSNYDLKGNSEQGRDGSRRLKKKFGVAFLNVSLKYHGNIIAGRQIVRNKILKLLLIEKVNALIDNHILLFLAMSKGSAILLEQISSSHADTGYVVGPARIDFAIPPQPSSVLGEKFVVDRGQESSVECRKS